MDQLQFGLSRRSAVHYKPFKPPKINTHTPIIAQPLCPSHPKRRCHLKNVSAGCLGEDAACFFHARTHSPARALMRERSNSRAELLSLSSSSSERSKRVLMWLYCCVISALSKSVVEVMAAARVAWRGGDGGGRRPQAESRRGCDSRTELGCRR